MQSFAVIYLLDEMGNSPGHIVQRLVVGQMDFLVFERLGAQTVAAGDHHGASCDQGSASTRSDLDDFVASYHAENRHERSESERFKCFAYDDLIKRDKVNLDIFWLKAESLEDSANLPAPDIIAAEIVEDLEAALAQFNEIAADLAPASMNEK
jgi:hypothetical protein